MAPVTALRPTGLSARIAAPLAAALGLHAWLLWPHARSDEVPFDALHLYFPLAESLLREGWSFFATERSLQAPPFSFVYPAMLGVSAPVVKSVNFALSFVTLIMLARTASIAHSAIAGVVAAFLFALSPLLRPWLAAPLTEPIFIFLCAAWIWALAEWLRGGARTFVVLGALALSLAILTRGTLFYLPFAMLALFGGLAWKGQDPRGARGALVMHALALLPPVAFLLKNWMLFGFAFFATGAGNALYLGNNPLTGGYDPVYLGLVFDVGSIARDQSHLTLEAERLLGAAARVVVATQDLGAQLALHARKLGAFLFVTNAEMVDHPLLLRSWRIALFVLAGMGAYALRRQVLGWALVLVLGYQIAVHVPVLFTFRYSVGAIDQWLVLLAAVGIATFATDRRPRRIALATATLALALVGGVLVYRYGGMPEPNVFGAARLRVWEGAPQRHRLEGSTEIRIPIGDAPKFHPWNNHVLVLEAALKRAGADGACGWTHIAFQRHDSDRFGVEVARHLRPDGNVRQLQVGATTPFRIDAEGVLRLRVECAGGGELDIRRTAVYAPMGGFDYRAKILGEPMSPDLER
jgi:hypothetical protein